MQNIQQVNLAIEKERQALLNHPLYQRIKTPTHLSIFMQTHVYAVWDFMSLLKALQIKLTCTQVPWFASDFPNTRYLINEIVLAEESDLSLDQRRLSHFEMYLEAMQDAQADTSEITEFIENLKKGTPISQNIQQAKIGPAVKEFLNFTFDTINQGKLHNIAAAFTFGREDLIPDMFTSILKELQNNFPNQNLDQFIYYFDRHIELDGDEHGPMAMTMVKELAGNDPQKWQEIIQCSKLALQKRIALWDSILEQININDNII
ncbi:DUF3050 domain-containing protein [Myroides sp. LJL119]